jgi:hypothetical protein
MIPNNTIGIYEYRIQISHFNVGFKSSDDCWQNATVK